jgi:hypothetical protein
VTEGPEIGLRNLYQFPSKVTFQVSARYRIGLVYEWFAHKVESAVTVAHDVGRG